MQRSQYNSAHNAAVLRSELAQRQRYVYIYTYRDRNKDIYIYRASGKVIDIFIYRAQNKDINNIYIRLAAKTDICKASGIYQRAVSVHSFGTHFLN